MTENQENEAPVCYVQALPTEVLRYVFQHCIDEERKCDPAINSLDIKKGVVWTLSYVCRSWRALVRGTPEFWSRIVLIDKGPPLPYRILRLIIKRTRQVPLDILSLTPPLPRSKFIMDSQSEIQVADESDSDSDFSDDELRYNRKVIGDLSSTIHRWRDMAATSDEVNGFFLDLITRGDWRLLRYLFVNAHKTFLDLQWNAPRLKEIVVHHAVLRKLTLPWPQLTTIRLIHADLDHWSELFDILNQTKSLVHFTAYLEGKESMDNELDPNDDTLITLPALRTLTIEGRFFDPEPLIKRIKTPLIQRIYLELAHPDVFESLKGLLANSEGLLEDLRFGMCMFDVDEFIIVLKQTPALNNLQLGSFDTFTPRYSLELAVAGVSPPYIVRLKDVDEFFLALTLLPPTEDVRSDILCPRLETLRLDTIHADPNIILDMLESRNPPRDSQSTAEVSKLTKVEIFGASIPFEDAASQSRLNRLKEDGLDMKIYIGPRQRVVADEDPRNMVYGMGYEDPWAEPQYSEEWVDGTIF